MIELRATIKNEAGIHCRPTAVIMKEVKGYDGEMEVVADSGSCDPRSALALLSLGLYRGLQIKIRVSGPDEEATCRKMVDLFETEYDFPPREDGEKAELPAELL